MIRAKDLTLAYEKDKNIIENTNFEILDKEFIIISGQSGSGKSTILKSFYGKLAVKSGSLVVNNIDITKKRYNQTLELRKNMGIVFQDYKLIPDYTIEDNIKEPLRILQYEEDIINKQVDKLLKHVKLSHKKGAYPEQLSGGEQQRVALARALSHNPSIILADEPTGNLDKYSANIVWQLLQNANEQLGITVVVVTHRIPSNIHVDYRRFNIDERVMYEVA